MAMQFDDYEKHAQRLEQMAETVDKKGAEYAALERAGWALAFVTIYHHREFQKFLDEQKRGTLSPQELAHLNKLGLK